jgi:stage V sporulation protein B
LSKQSFIQGTMILIVVGIITKILGMLNKITLSRVIGAEGMGLYHMAFPTLILMLTLTTGGFPVAISKRIAEAEAKNDSARVKQILWISMTCVFGLSFLLSLVLWFASPIITKYFLTDQRVLYTLLATAPSIIIIGVGSVLRAYFQGKLNMIPTASSQFIESLVRVISALLFAHWLLPFGVEWSAAGAMIGLLVGELFGLFMLLYHYWQEPNRFKSYEQQIPFTHWLNEAKKLLQITIPVTGSKIVGSLSLFFEPIIIAQSLALAGLATVAVTSFYGQLAGMAIPILLFPTVLTYSISVTLIPALSEAAASNNLKLVHKRLHQALRLALVTGAPCTVVMYVLAEPLSLLVFNDIEVARFLQMMAPFALFLYFQGPLAAALQALDQAKTALRNTIIGAVLKVITVFVLASQPEIAINGVVYAININMAIVTVLHFISVVKLLSFTMKAIDTIKVGLAMMLMGWLCYEVMVHPIFSSLWIQFMMSLWVGFIVYIWLLVILKIVDKHDLERIPWIGKWITYMT